MKTRTMICRSRWFFAVTLGLGVGWAMSASLGWSVGLAIGAGLTLVMLKTRQES